MKKIIEHQPIYLALFCIHAPISHHQIYGYFYDYYNLAVALLIFSSIGLLLFFVARRYVCDVQIACLVALVGLFLLLPFPSLASPVIFIAGIAGISLIAFQFVRRKGADGRRTMRRAEASLDG